MYPGQPGGYPGGYPPVPSHPGRIEQGPPPSGGTAITAAVLSILGALAFVFVIVQGIATIDKIPFYGWVSLLGGILTLGLLASGAALVFTRKPVARYLILAGCLVVLVILVIDAITMSSYVNQQVNLGVRAGEFPASDAPQARQAIYTTFIVFAVIGAIPAIATGILAMVPPTRRYLEAGHRPQGGYPPPGGAPMGYPPPMGGPPPGPPPLGGQPPYGPPPPGSW